MGFRADADNLYDRWIWPNDFDSLPIYRRAPILAFRIALALITDFRDGEITLRAMGLVYTTLVSLVPLLALAFSLLKAFGVNDALRPTLQRFLAPLGAGSTEIVDKIVGFVSNVQVGVLGAIGVIVLIYSVLSLVQKVEAGCNFIWQVQVSRSIRRRITDYLSVIVAGPLVILAAASLTASLGKNSSVAYLEHLAPFGTLIYTLGLLLPYVLYSIGFTLLFKFITNTRVETWPAIGGGIFAGVLWQAAGVAFAVFAKNAGNVNAIYSSFAILILLLSWLYMSWMILLLGCRVAFWLQHPQQLTRGHYPPRLGSAEAERLVLLTAVAIADRYARGNGATDVELLARQLHTAPEHVQTAFERLRAANLLLEIVDESGPRVVMRAEADQMRVRDILNTVRAGEPSARLTPSDAIPASRTDQMLARVEAARNEVIGTTTLRELVGASAQNAPYASQTSD